MNFSHSLPYICKATLVHPFSPRTVVQLGIYFCRRYSWSWLHLFQRLSCFIWLSVSQRVPETHPTRACIFFVFTFLSFPLWAVPYYSLGTQWTHPIGNQNFKITTLYSIFKERFVYWLHIIKVKWNISWVIIQEVYLFVNYLFKLLGDGWYSCQTP